MTTRSPTSLRRRATIAFTVLGFALSVLFAVATGWITEDYEHLLAAEILQGQSEDYSLRLAAGAPSPLPQTQRLSGYAGDASGLPREYAALAPGIHEDDSRDGIHIGVFDTRAGRVTFVIDLSDIEELETHLSWFLAAMVVLGTSVAGWLGWLLAGRVVAPVAGLAAAVDALPVRPRRTSLADTVSRDELGRVARAIDEYQARMVDADEREQAFFADASHELRTPIAVVRGAAEILADDAGADSRLRPWLQRLDRGVQELTDLLDVLLGLARRNELEIEDVDARSLLRDSSAAVVATRQGIRAEIDAAGSLRVPRRESLLLMRSVIRQVASDDSGTLRLRARDGVIDVEFIRSTVDNATQRYPSMQRSDTGMPATLMHRLLHHVGWTLVETERGVRIRLASAP